MVRIPPDFESKPLAVPSDVKTCSTCTYATRATDYSRLRSEPRKHKERARRFEQSPKQDRQGTCRTFWHVLRTRVATITCDDLCTGPACHGATFAMPDTGDTVGNLRRVRHRVRVAWRRPSLPVLVLCKSSLFSVESNLSNGSSKRKRGPARHGMQKEAGAQKRKQKSAAVQSRAVHWSACQSVNL
jgi:hypothetical protein